MTQPLPGLEVESIEEMLARRRQEVAEPPVPEPAQATPPNAGPVIGTKAFDARRQAGYQKQEQLEEKHGKLDTLGTQLSRGLLGAITAPGALVGAAAEALGEATNTDVLRDFGRDFGEASTGAAALEAMAAVFGGTGEQRITAADRARQVIKEQEQAWPTLSAVSQAAGGIALGVAVGVGAGAAGMANAATGQLIATGIGEGAAAGAQGAYERQAPLRNVLVSTLVGATLGGVVAGAPGVLKSVRFRKGLNEFADRRTIKAIGARGSDLKKLARAANVAEEQMHKVAQTVRDFEFQDGRKIFRALADPGEHAVAIREAREEVGKRIGALREGADEVLAINPDLAPDVSRIAERIHKEVIVPVGSSPLSATRSQAKPLVTLVDDVKALAAKDTGKTSIKRLYELRSQLDDQIYQAKRGVNLAQQGAPPNLKHLEQARNIIEEGIEEAADKASKHMKDPHVYEALKKDYRNLKLAEDIAGAAALQDLGNRVASPTDMLAGAAVLAGDLAGGGGALSAVKGLAAGAIHQAIRKKSSGLLAVAAARIARSGGSEAAGVYGARQAGRAGQSLLRPAIKSELTTGLLTDSVTEQVIGDQVADALQSQTGGGLRVGGRLAASRTAGGLAAVFGEREALPEIPLELAGGREGQEVLTSVQRAHQHVREAEEAAGSNPDQRQRARQQAQERAANNLAEQAGDFDATQWRQKPPTPLQKAVYRKPILDQIADDIARDAANPPRPRPLELKPERVKSLSRDADETTAIGTTQDALLGFLEEVPATPDGDEMAFAIRAARQELSTADVPQTMAVAHRLAQQLRQVVDYSPDELTRSWAARHAVSIEQVLSSEAFGSAGAAYRLALAPTSPDLEALSDPVQLRELLRRAEGKGVVLKPLLEQKDAALSAAMAIEQLSGQKGAKRELEAQYKELEERFAAAEDAVTFDGASAGRLTDYFQDQLDNRVVRTVGDDITQVTANAVRPKLERLAPILRGSTERRKDMAQRTFATRASLAEYHRDRLETLEELLGDVDTLDLVGEGLKAFPGVQGDLQESVNADMTRVLGKLYDDLPKPEPNIRGPAYASLSSDDLRRANAMWEATVEPTSIVDDFEAGAVDYDKVDYVEKQYPGLLTAMQAGVVDLLSGMDQREYEGVPETVLSQVDYVFGFHGTLQDTVGFEFGQRMTAASEQEAEQKKQGGGGGGLKMPNVETGPQRIARGRA